MEDRVYHELNEQINTTETMLKDKMVFDSVQYLIVQNQLVIMKLLDKLDEKIRSIPR